MIAISLSAIKNLSSFMVAHAKQRKGNGLKKQVRAPGAQWTPALSRGRRPEADAEEEQAPKSEDVETEADLGADEEEPKEADLAKEEATLKPEEIETATLEVEQAETVHRGRERSSYDGDTAIKLYLREIGQVKLLTPQEEIELAARIKPVAIKRPASR